MSWRQHLRASLDALSVYDVPPSTAPSRMHANECAEPWPAEVREALAEVVRGELEFNRYPDTSGRTLRHVLAQRHGCEPRQIVIGNGSDEVISMLLTALSQTKPSEQPGAGGHLVIPTPTFVMYAHCAAVLGVPVVEVPLDARFELDEPAMRAALGPREGSGSERGAAICFLARPNNPTSSLWSRQVVQGLIADFPDTVFVIDEAYTAYAPGESFWGAWEGPPPDNYVHMATLSKVGLAALRVGYCVAHPDLALALDKVRHPYNVSQTSIALAETVLTRFADVQDQLVAKTIANRGRLVTLLGSIPDAEVFPAHANFVLVRLPSTARAQALRTTLAEAGVLIKDLTKTPALAGCVRVSVGTDGDLDRLEAALARG